MEKSDFSIEKPYTHPSFFLATPSPSVFSVIKLRLRFYPLLYNVAMHKFKVSTQTRQQVLDITPQVQSTVAQSACRDGIVVVYCPHTTAALSVNENADPDVKTDLLKHLSEMIPAKSSFLHSEGNSDAHIKTVLSGPSLTLLVEDGRLQLGTWQGLYFLEFDGPRHREVWVKCLST